MSRHYSYPTIPQFTKLVAKQSFQIKYQGFPGRPVNVKVGDVFTVTNPEHMQEKGIKLDRKKTARLCSGHPFTSEQINHYFIVEGW